MNSKQYTFYNVTVRFCIVFALVRFFGAVRMGLNILSCEEVHLLHFCINFSDIHGHNIQVLISVTILV